MIQSRGVKKAVSVFVRGVVQGVGYRNFAVQTAIRFGIGGWVKNYKDGSVEIECEGDTSAVIAFLARLEKGPQFSKVTSVDVKEIPYRGIYHHFTVEY